MTMPLPNEAPSRAHALGGEDAEAEPVYRRRGRRNQRYSV
jgi:hypothetical protein